MLAVLALFDDETAEKLTEVYETLKKEGFMGTQSKDIPYHFTMGMFKPDQESMLIELLENVSKNTKAIDFRFNHIGLFGLKVIFAAPNMNYEILDLQKHFFAECTKGNHMWAAHATLLMNEAEVIAKALPIVAAKFTPMKSSIKQLALYEFFPSRLIRIFDLQAI